MELYHVYNRGVDKRNIVSDDRDRFRFVHDLHEFNDSAPVQSNYFTFTRDIGCPVFGKRSKNRDELVHLHAWCLMGNHYHLMISEAQADGMAKFMKKLSMGYTKYFNEKYERSGALWQGKYKRRPLINDSHFLWLPLYIHLNPTETNTPLEGYRWSSHLDYLGKKNFPSVLYTELLESVFSQGGGYQQALQKALQFKELRSTVSSIVFEE